MLSDDATVESNVFKLTTEIKIGSDREYNSQPVAEDEEKPTIITQVKYVTFRKTVYNKFKEASKGDVNQPNYLIFVRDVTADHIYKTSQWT